MKRFYITLLTLILSGSFLTMQAQNVGIGTTTPDEPLDLNGNIHMRGNFKVNGNFGTDGQVLMNSGGNTVWSDVAGSYKSEFKSFATYITAGTSTWTVPAGVTKVMVEAWGGGGGGNEAAGVGGGYITAVINVSPGQSFQIFVGKGGKGAQSDGNNGFFSGVSTAGITVYAGGGKGASGYRSAVTPGLGGIFQVSPGFHQFFAVNGERGEGATFRIETQNATTSYFVNQGGRGGNAANTQFTGASPLISITKLPAGTRITRHIFQHASSPGGGGAGGNPPIVPGEDATFGSDGADGRVIIYL